MEQIISKELLSEVVKYKYATIKSHRLSGKHIEVLCNETNSKDKINIYELAHKCKEWAAKEGYTLIEYPFAVELYNEKLVLRCCKIKDKTTILYCPSRVFKACQWILDNKEKQ